MLVYRIAKSADRAQDLSGFGALKLGGRWNSRGTYMLYTSANSSLAFLENLVHFNEAEVPPNLYVATIEINDDALIYELPDANYPADWQLPDNLPNKLMGDKWMQAKQFLPFKVRSAVNPSEYNFLLNPLYPEFHSHVKIIKVEQLNIDARLIK